MFYWAKYGTQTDIRFPMVKRAVVDLAATADWTPAAGDTKVSKDGGNVANTSNNPAAVGGTGSIMWKLTLSATELQAAEVDVQIVDSATKAVEDQCLVVYTYGHASAKIQADLSDVVRLGLTALPNATAEAAGGLYTRGTGAGQLNQPANGQLDANAVKVGGTTQTGRDLGASVLVSAGTGTGQFDLTSGVVKANLAQILGTALTETAGQIAGAFKKFFDKAAPTGTILSLPDAVAGASGGVAIVGSAMGAVASVTGAVTLANAQGFRKNTAFTGFTFQMVDPFTGLGKTGLGVTAQRSLDGAALGACANAVSEMSLGLYKLTLAAGDLNADLSILLFTATGALDLSIPIRTVQP